MVFQFKIQIKELKNPTVWRRVMVPDTFTFKQFHEVIQAAFGWWNYHLYEFTDDANPIIHIGIPDDEFPEFAYDDSNLFQLLDVFRFEGQTINYEYDFGDSWEHSITLEKIFNQRAKRAMLITGKGACPPEDCGGIYGYRNILKKLQNPTDEEYESLRTWLGLKVGKNWNKETFDYAKAQLAVWAVK